MPVSLGGMAVNPGDIVVGDQDGLLAFPPEDAKSSSSRPATARSEAKTIAGDEGRAAGTASFIDALEARCNN